MGTQYLYSQKAGFFYDLRNTDSGPDGKDAMEFREQTLLEHLLVSPFLFVWSLAVYAFAISCHPFPHNIISYLAYYGFLCILGIIWIWLFDATFKIRQFAVQRGLINQCDTVLFIFRLRRQYARESIKEITTEFRSSFLTSGYHALLISRRGKKVHFRKFHSQKEAEEFCLQIKECIDEKELIPLSNQDAEKRHST